MKKKSGKYQIMNIVMNINKFIIKNINLFSNCEKFIKDFTEIIILSLLNFYTEYD